MLCACHAMPGTWVLTWFMVLPDAQKGPQRGRHSASSYALAIPCAILTVCAALQVEIGLRGVLETLSSFVLESGKLHYRITRAVCNDWY